MIHAEAGMCSGRCLCPVHHHGTTIRHAIRTCQHGDHSEGRVLLGQRRGLNGQSEACLRVVTQNDSSSHDLSPDSDCIVARCACQSGGHASILDMRGCQVILSSYNDSTAR